MSWPPTTLVVNNCVRNVLLTAHSVLGLLHVTTEDILEYLNHARGDRLLQRT